MNHTESTEIIAQGWQSRPKKKRKWRNLLGFWILGLCNNYAYVIMLSGAFDLLRSPAHKNETRENCTYKCNDISTGAILLADILPSLTIKIIAPFIAIGFNYRVIIATALSVSSFIITSLSVDHWMTFLGVICAALSSGLGEVTFLALSSHFHKDVVSAWSSGTGGAGVVGALSYAALAAWLPLHSALQIMLIFPAIMAMTFWLLIDHPDYIKPKCCLKIQNLQTAASDSMDLSDVYAKKKKVYSLRQKINLIKPLLKYMVPLGLVYFAEYFINQGLMELLFFPNACSWLSHDDQYRWYQVDYQVGVLISRSSVNFFQIRKLWVLPVLQFINLILLFFEAYYHFMGSIWIVLALVFYEGLLGGSAYVNTFYKISQEVPEEDKEFSMGITSLADSTGITIAGVLALPVHSSLCKMR